MPQIPMPQHFEPNQQALKAWFGTRKDKMMFSQITLPGAFQTQNFGNDTVKFIVIILLELFGALAIMWAGQFAIFSIAPVILAIIVDLVFALRLHKYVAFRNLCENRALVENNPLEKTRFIELSKTKRNHDNLFRGLIILIGIFKGVAFMALTMEFGVIEVLMFVIYLIISALHINTTGYFFAELLLDFSFKKQYKKFISNSDKTFEAQERQSFFNSNHKIILANADNLHRIELDNTAGNEKGITAYKLITKGILTDTQLATLVNNQPTNDSQSIIAQACIKHQIINTVL